MNKHEFFDLEKNDIVYEITFPYNTGKYKIKEYQE